MSCCNNNQNCYHDPCGSSFNQLVTQAAQYAQYAQTQATSAAESAQDAQDVLDEFNKKYLGSFAIAPAGPQETGALYWNSNTNNLWVWNGTNWVLAVATEIYLGGFSTQPTTNNDGGPLTSGNLYWNTISNNLWAYNGSSWVLTNFNELTNFPLSYTTTISASSLVQGQEYQIVTVGSPATNWVAIGAPSATIGTRFTKNATAATGNGTAHQTRDLETRFSDFINVKDFGAVGDGVTDDTAFIQSAITAFNSIRTTRPATLFFPNGKYRVTASLDFSSIGAERGEVIGGDGTFEVATIIADYNGYNSNAVFRLGNPASPAYQSGISISGFKFEKGSLSTYQPIAINGARIAQSRISNITVGSWNNTFLSLAAPQNCRFENITLFGGGKSWLYKNSTGINATQSGTTVTASSAIFSSSDVGHTISIWGAAPSFQRRKMKIVSFTSATQVVVDFNFTDASAKSLYFDSPLVTINSGSSTLTADAPCFSSSDIGQNIYVKGAGANGRLLRAKIQSFISSTQITLSTTAQTSISDKEFTCPAVEVYTDTSATNGGSDNTFMNLQVENHRGVGVVLHDQDLLCFVNSKIHGEQTPDLSIPAFSQSCLWLDQVSGYFQGGMQAQYLDSSKIYVVYQTSSFNFESFSVRTAYNENIFEIDPKATSFDGGIINIGDLALAGAYSGETIDDIIIDNNTSSIGYFITGTVSYNEYNQTRTYTGNEGTVGWENLSVGSVSWTSGVSPTNPAATVYKWQRIGYIVFFEFRLEYNTAGSNNTGVTIIKQTDMPSPFFGPDVDPTDEYISACAGFITEDPALPPLPPSTSVAFIKYEASPLGATTFNVRLDSGTENAKLACISGFYFTK